jgi:hypothetical protein
MGPEYLQPVTKYQTLEALMVGRFCRLAGIGGFHWVCGMEVLIAFHDRVCAI